MPSPLRFRILKDPWSWATHFAGFLAAIVGLVFLVSHASHNATKLVAMTTYGVSLVTLFAASSMYHFFDLGLNGNRWLRRIDHCAIFFLIAGSYVPVSVHLLDGAWRIGLLSVICGLALCGIILKLVWIDCPDRVGVALYLLLGWAAVVPAYKILPQLDAAGIAWLSIGGAAYTLGALIYVKKRPDPYPDVFGYHEIWHLFVLMGAASHYFMNWGLMDHPIPGL